MYIIDFFLKSQIHLLLLSRNDWNKLYVVQDKDNEEKSRANNLALDKYYALPMPYFETLYIVFIVTTIDKLSLALKFVKRK